MGPTMAVNLHQGKTECMVIGDDRRRTSSYGWRMGTKAIRQNHHAYRYLGVLITPMMDMQMVVDDRCDRFRRAKD